MKAQCSRCCRLVTVTCWATMQLLPALLHHTLHLRPQAHPRARSLQRETASSLRPHDQNFKSVHYLNSKFRLFLGTPTSIFHGQKLHCQKRLGILLPECLFGSPEYVLVYARLSDVFVGSTTVYLVGPCFSNFLNHSPFPSTKKHSLASPRTRCGKPCLCVVSPRPHFSGYREI